MSWRSENEEIEARNGENRLGSREKNRVFVFGRGMRNEGEKRRKSGLMTRGLDISESIDMPMCVSIDFKAVPYLSFFSF